MPSPDSSTPNYLRKLMECLATKGAFSPGSETHIAVYHDDWCAIHRGKACNCNPDVALMDKPDIPVR